MQRRFATMSVLVALLAVSLTAITLTGQTAAPLTPNSAKAWTPPRGPDGHPDISGVWVHNAATPMERPAELAGRAMLTDDELKAMQQKAAELFNGEGDAGFGDSIYLAALHNVLGKEKGFKSRDVTTGDYNSFWVQDRWFEKRTSLITDPPDGKFPPLTADAQKRRDAVAEYRKVHEFDGPEDLPVGQRCITGSVPMLGAGYNNYYQIVQTPTYVGINMEMRHDTRAIPIVSRPHLPANVHLWLGDPVGQWQGDTFVIDTTNFRDDSPIGQGGASGAATNTHLTERLTRAGQNTLQYEVTVDNQATWTKPWTAVLMLKRSKDQIYEYACHEGNEAMSGALRGARVQEQKKKAAPPTSTTSNPR